VAAPCTGCANCRRVRTAAAVLDSHQRRLVNGSDEPVVGASQGVHDARRLSQRVARGLCKAEMATGSGAAPLQTCISWAGSWLFTWMMIGIGRYLQVEHMHGQANTASATAGGRRKRRNWGPNMTRHKKQHHSSQLWRQDCAQTALETVKRNSGGVHIVRVDQPDSEAGVPCKGAVHRALPQHLPRYRNSFLTLASQMIPPWTKPGVTCRASRQVPHQRLQ